MGHFPSGGPGGGGISEITSTGATVEVTDPTGPVTDLEVPAPTPYTPPIDRLALQLSTSTSGAVDWTSATVLENTGTSFNVVNGPAGYIETVEAGVYAFTANLELGFGAGAAEITEIFWQDTGSIWNSSSFRNGKNLTPSGGVTGVNDQSPLTLCYYFPAGDQHTFTIQWGANTSLPVFFQVAFQRIS